MFTTANRQALTPEQVQDLFIRPALALSVAAQVTTIDQTSAHETRFPIITKDPIAAWTAEGAEITPSDPQVDEIIVTPSKVAGLVIASNEVMNDALESAIQQVGEGLVRQTVNAIDSAFFATEALPDAPQGLGTAADVNPLTGDLADLDIFEAAIAAARDNGQEVDNFVCSTADALKLATLKESTTSARGLLTPDMTQPNAMLISGRKLVASRYVAEGTIWAIPQAAVHTVIRQDATVESDPSPYFSSDKTAIRSVARIGFAVLHPASISKITVTA